jgi:hypothetical protein
MNGFKKCNNGHFYKEDLNACPYCPGGSNNTSPGGNDDLGKTMVTSPGSMGGGFSSNDSKTEVFGNGNSSSDNTTQVFGGANGGSFGGAPKRDLNRTFIGGMEETSDSNTGSPIKSEPRATRRIVGWIISYDLDPMGVDYRIYEGTNTIGRDTKNTIIITKDSTISSEHVTILYKKGKFKIKDRMTANGTFLNGEELEVEEAYDLNDGDDLKVGNTVFKFKTAE